MSLQPRLGRWLQLLHHVRCHTGLRACRMRCHIPVSTRASTQCRVKRPCPWQTITHRPRRGLKGRLLTNGPCNSRCLKRSNGRLPRKPIVLVLTDTLSTPSSSRRRRRPMVTATWDPTKVHQISSDWHSTQAIPMSRLLPLPDNKGTLQEIQQATAHRMECNRHTTPNSLYIPDTPMGLCLRGQCRLR